MEQQAREQAFISALTTEQFVLQAARSANIGEMTGRATVYMGAVSSSLIALGSWPRSSPTSTHLSLRCCRAWSCLGSSPSPHWCATPWRTWCCCGRCSGSAATTAPGPRGRPVLRPSCRGGAVQRRDGHGGAAGPARGDAVHRSQRDRRDQQHRGRGRPGPAGGQGREPDDGRRAGGRIAAAVVLFGLHLLYQQQRAADRVLRPPAQASSA
jgi:hypothetical protein